MSAYGNITCPICLDSYYELGLHECSADLLIMRQAESGEKIKALEYEVAQLRKMTAEYCNTQLVMTIDRLQAKIEALENAIKSGREKGVNMSGFYGEGWQDAVAFIYLLSLEAGE